MQENREAVYLDYPQAQKHQQRYCCAGCWGHLTIYNTRRDDRKVIIRCNQCGDGRGFVTKTYAERREAESRAEYIEAKRNIGKVIGLESEKKTTEQILKEIGHDRQ